MTVDCLSSLTYEYVHTSLFLALYFITKVVYVFRQFQWPRGLFYGVSLRPLVCWDCEFESRRGHGYLSVVSVVCCQVEVSATG
jgi:hypothetical protein